MSPYPFVDCGATFGLSDETKVIAKNNGLTPKRKKKQRNPCVKTKLKFRKAKFRRGQVHEARIEMSHYGRDRGSGLV